MLIGATQILGPIPARSLDPLLLVRSQPPEMRGYVVLSPAGGTDPVNREGERTWDAVLLAGNPEPDLLRITETTRWLLPPSHFEQDVQQSRKRELDVHLFEAPERLLREFLSTVHADPVLKVALDTLDLRQVEALLAGSNVRSGILERTDCSGELPRFELVRISTSVDELGLPFTLPRLRLGYETGGMALYHLDPGIDLPRSRSPENAAQTRAGAQKGERGVVGRRRASLSEALAPLGPGKPHEPDPVLVMFQRLLRSFRKKGVESLGGRWEDALRSAVARVRVVAPEFQADALSSSTAPQTLDLILEVVASAPFLKRSRLRESALLLIADIYDTHYDLLEARALVDRVEQAYLKLKR